MEGAEDADDDTGLGLVGAGRPWSCRHGWKRTTMYRQRAEEEGEWSCCAAVQIADRRWMQGLAIRYMCRILLSEDGNYFESPRC